MSKNLIIRIKHSNLAKLLMLILCVCLITGCDNSKLTEKNLSSDEVLKLTEKIANSYIENESDVKPNPFLYTGMFQLSKVSHYPKYINWLIETGEKNNWEIPHDTTQPVDYSVSHHYLSIYRKPHLGREIIIQSTQQALDSIINKKEEKQWTQLKDLFLKPAVLAIWSKVKKDTTNTYLAYMHTNYQSVYSDLWDEEVNLFHSDNASADKKGNTSFSSLKNSGVFAGLALLISELPEEWEKSVFYKKLFKKMAQTVKETQQKDGTWPKDLKGDANENSLTSATSFFTFGIAWGINIGLLDKTEFEPVLLKAWNSIADKIQEKGELNFSENPTDDEDYASGFGIGGIMAAGSEMYEFITKFYPIDKSTSYTTFMKDGGWCWYQDPRAIISNQKLIIGGLSGQSGDVRLGIFDLKNEALDSIITLAEDIGADDHNVPALYKRPDESILAVWAKHAREKKHYSSISTSKDFLNWSVIDTFEHDYKKGPGVTYMNLHYLENQNKLYNFFRDGTNFNPSFITSPDYGKTWGNRTHFISNEVKGFQRPYAKYLQVDKNTIGVSYTDAHPRKYGNNIYYAEFKNNNFYTVDGEFIKSLDEGPLVSSMAEKIFTGSSTMDKPAVNESVPNSAWTVAMVKDQDNHPHIGYSLYLNDDDLRFRIASWDGQKWNDREIAYAGKSLYKIESSYSGLLAFDPTDPTQVYISTDVNPSTGEDLGGKHEIYTAKVDAEDDISSIKWTALTHNSPHRNIRPVVVADEGYKVLLWLYGPWKTFKNYDVNVVGKILEYPEQ